MTQEKSFVSHLLELRKRLLVCIVTVMSLFVVFLIFNQALYSLLALPLQKHLHLSSYMIAINLVTPMVTPLKLCFILAIFTSLPVLFYQLWAFVSPGLYHREKTKIWPYVCVSLLLFYLGITFAYFVGFPLLFSFFTKLTPTNIHLLPEMSQYLDLCLQLFIAFGVIFETPLVTYVLIQSSWMRMETIHEIRRYVIVLAFVVGMLLTPPDVISQIMLAVPMWFLFELGVLAARIHNSPRFRNKRTIVHEP